MVPLKCFFNQDWTLNDDITRGADGFPVPRQTETRVPDPGELPPVPVSSPSYLLKREDKSGKAEYA
jgi:hypothetical protein